MKNIEMTSVKCFGTVKEGGKKFEYEDAYWVPRNLELPLRLAVADGATETSFSGLWARILVKAYGKGLLDFDTWDTNLSRARSIWRAIVGKKSLSWYGEEKAKLGAYASFLGVTFYPDYTFRVLAVGDCCVMHVGEQILKMSFPISDPCVFQSRPELICSLSNSAIRDPIPIRLNGSWRSGDLFVLATDALSLWLLRSVECGFNPWPLLSSISDERQFADFVCFRRQSDCPGDYIKLKNDDVTLVSCILGSSSP